MDNPYYDIVLKNYGSKELLYDPDKILNQPWDKMDRDEMRKRFKEAEEELEAGNPLRASELVGKRLGSFMLRDHCVKYFSFAIPDKAALEEIRKFTPIIEIGSGAGYWAYCLNQIGVTVKCFDTGERKDFTKIWTQPESGTHEMIREHPYHTLFLCWPPYTEPMAADCLKIYSGEYFIYIGEGYGGCTGDDEFHNILDAEWTSVSEVSIPQWDGIHDYMTVYKRGKDVKRFVEEIS